MLGDFDLVKLLGVAFLLLSLTLGMSDDLIEVLGMESVDDIEEKLARRKFIGFVDVPEEHAKLRVFPHIVPEVLDAEFIVVGHDDGPQLAARDELLLVGQDLLLQEVLVH